MNLCLDELRRIKRRRELSILPHTIDSSDTEIWEELPSDGPAPDHSTASEEQADLVRKAVAALPEHYRSVVILRHYQDLKFREIADVLQVPEGTVRSYVFHARRALRKALATLVEEPA